MDSWDDDEFEVPSLEGSSNSAVAAVTWEDEEEVSEEEDAAVTTNNDGPVDMSKLKPKQIKKLKMKKLEEKKKMNAAIAKAKAEEQANETPSERRAREQAAIEEADYENTLDAFGPGDDDVTATKSSAAAPSSAPAKIDSVDDLEGLMSSLSVKSLADHEKLAELVGEKLSTSHNSLHVVEFLKTLLQKCSANLTPDHLKDVTTVFNVIKNEKIQAAKPKSKKKKVTGKAGYAKMERGNAGGGGQYDDSYYDDFDDFM